MTTMWGQQRAAGAVDLVLKQRQINWGLQAFLTEIKAFLTQQNLKFIHGNWFYATQKYKALLINKPLLKTSTKNKTKSKQIQQ